MALPGQVRQQASEMPGVVVQKENQLENLTQPQHRWPHVTWEHVTVVLMGPCHILLGSLI